MFRVFPLSVSKIDYGNVLEHSLNFLKCSVLSEVFSTADKASRKADHNDSLMSFLRSVSEASVMIHGDVETAVGFGIKEAMETAGFHN